MSKITGGLAAVAIWFGAVSAAEAQGIEVNGTGPTSVLNSDTQCTVTATVTGISSYMYNVSIKVNSVTRHNKNYFGSGSSISRLVTGMGTWGMQAGQSFETKVTISGVSDSLTITIGQGGTYLLPENVRPSLLPAARKEEELCLVEADEERVA